MTVISRVILLILTLALPALLLLFGYFNRINILSKNECQMTMSIKGRKSIDVNSEIAGPKLYKYLTKSSTKTSDANQWNPQPVLFIPGHLGK